MEIYFVNVVEDLAVTALLVGLVFAYARDAKGLFGMRVVTGGIAIAAIASIAMAIAKQNTSKIATGDWNMGIFVVSLFAVLAALIAAIVLAMARRGKKRVSEDSASSEGSADDNAVANVSQNILLFVFTLFMMLRIFYMLPDVINYPANFGISADNLVSTDFAFRIIGYLLGICLSVLTCVSISKACKALSHRMMGVAAGAMIVLVCIMQTVSLVQILIARRIIKAGTDLYSAAFSVTTWFSNNALLFELLVMAIALALAVFIIVISLRDAEPYSNPAEHRKNRAKWRNRRRWAICLIVCLVLTILTVTVVKDYVNRGPELSPAEECEVRDGNVYVPLESLEDGHLHRFNYTTEAGVPLEGNKQTSGGVDVRFIVIKKPNSSAYGVGMDACEICGETGYYERDGQVVCKLCDVVMNINTIGFKGGCNPLPVEYSVEGGYIVLPCDALSKFEPEFK